MHTTDLDLGGRRAWMIHNGDFSGETVIRWEDEGAPPADGKEASYHEAVLPDGMLRSVVLAVATVQIPGKVETFLNSDAGQRLVERLLFR